MTSNTACTLVPYTYVLNLNRQMLVLYKQNEHYMSKLTRNLISALCKYPALSHPLGDLSRDSSLMAEFS